MCENTDLLDEDPPQEPWPWRLKIPLLLVSIILVGGVGTWVGAVFFDDEPDPFAPIEYASPGVVEFADGEVPTVEAAPGLPGPSIRVRDDVPLRLTRTVDCVNWECPGGGIPVLADVRWVRLNVQGTSIGTYSVAEDIDVTYEETSDYVRDGSLEVTNQLTPFPVPDVVRGVLDSENVSSSAWRIEGVTTPVQSGGQPAAWVSETIHIFSPEFVEDDE